MSSERRSSDFDTYIARSVGQLVSSSSSGEVSSEANEESFATVEQRWAAHKTRTRRLGVALACTIPVLAGVAGYWARVPHSEPASAVLTYRVGGGPTLPPGRLIQANGEHEVTDVAFSDGTHVRLEPRTRGRVVTLDGRGGRMALYDGRARVDVRHLKNARWLFQAGPFEVQVRGTVFSIAWDATAAHFELRMESGVVSVAGPIAGGEVLLRAGESLSVGLHDNEAKATSLPGGSLELPAGITARMTTEKEGPSRRASASLVARQRRIAATGGVRRTYPIDWRMALEDGDANAVVEDAERRGIDRVLESATSEDLAALADAARYVRRDELARRTLLAQRRRFPRSSRAAEALFLLGRLEGESLGSAPRALDWYDRYLTEAPHGAYVAEALGCKMIVLQRTQRHGEARSIAAEYVRRFPSGSYAHAARALIDDPRATPPRGPPHTP